MGNIFYSINEQASDRNSETPKVDELEKRFVGDLLERLDAVQTKFKKCMDEVRKMERNQRRCEETLQQSKDGYEKSIQELTRKNQELDCQKQEMCKSNQQLNKEVEDLKKLREEHKQEIEHLQSSKRRQDETIVQLTRNNLEKGKKIAEMEKKLSASRDARVRNRDIRPGDVTHGYVKDEFVDYFNTERNLFEPFGIEKQPDERSQLLTNILQVAFLVCRDQALETLGDELKSLYVPPQRPVIRDFFSKKQVPEEWRYRREAFSILLSLSKIDPHKQPPNITKLVKQRLEDSEPMQKFISQSADTMNELMGNAAKLAWEMVTLVPPAVLGTPDIKADDWQTLAYGSDESEDSKIIYRKPILFFGAWGDVGEKGEIKLVSDQEDLAQTNKPNPCKAIKREKGISFDTERSQGADAQASTIQCKQTIVPGNLECEESPPVLVDPEVDQLPQPCAVQSPEMPTPEDENLALTKSPPTASSLHGASNMPDSQLGTGNFSQLKNTSKTIQIADNSTKDESTHSRVQPRSIEGSTDENPTVQRSTEKLSHSHHTPAPGTPPSDNTCAPEIITLQEQNSASGNGSLEDESNPLVESTFIEQKTALPKEIARKRDSNNSSLSEDEGTMLRAKAQCQQQGSTKHHQPSSSPRSLAKECETATKRQESQEAVKNDKISELAQVSKPDGLTAETTNEVPPLDQDRGTAYHIDTKTIDHKKASQSHECLGAVMPSPSASEACAQTIETDNNSRRTGGIVRQEDTRNSLAAQLSTEHSSENPASMDPASEKKTSQSDACASKRSDLSSQNSSDNGDGGKQIHVPKKRHKKTKRKQKPKQDSSMSENRYQCPVLETSTKAMSQGSPYGKAKTPSPDLSSLSNTPDTDQHGELSGVD